MNEMIYSFRESKVRIVEIEGEAWFVGNDVAEVLGYVNIHKAVTDHVEKEDRKSLSYKASTELGLSLWGANDFSNKTVINESGVYSLIFSSQLPAAKEFKRWLTHEVLPSIRKHGIYATDEILEKTLDDPDFMIGLLQKLKEEKAARQEAEKVVTILTHVNKTYTATEIAKELGFKSANALNVQLRDKGVQYKQNQTWVLYSKYADKGYVDIKQEVLDSGRVIYHRRFTQIGREFLVKLFNK